MGKVYNSKEKKKSAAENKKIEILNHWQNDLRHLGDLLKAQKC